MRHAGSIIIQFNLEDALTIKPLAEIRWFHRVPLKDGSITQGLAPIFEKEGNYLTNRIQFNGKSVLDVACWDGGHCIMAEQRGATRVVGLDNPEYRWGGMDGWEFLMDHFQSKSEYRLGNVYDLPPERFDIVLCYGLLYHLTDPLLAASNCFQVANELVAFTGNFYESSDPSLILWESGERNGDPSNVYSLSTGFIDLVAKQNGFTLETKNIRARGIGGIGLNALRPQTSIKRDQGGLIYRRTSELVPGYPSSCLPKNITSPLR
jgi:SAM-dependent methyltransferase